MSTIKAGNIQPQSDSDPLVLSTNAAERMRIDTSGNVGIGTAPTSYRLTVAGSNPQFSVIDSGTNLSRALITVTPNGVSFGTTYSTTAIPLGFNIGVTEVARLDTSGRFGIGTTSPTGLLTVFQNTREATSGGLTGSFAKTGILLESTLNGSGDPQYGPGLFWKTTANNNHPMAGIFVGGRGLGTCINLATATTYANGINKIGMTITDGKVGIGTTGPSSALHVVGDALFSGGITAGSFSAGNIAPLPTSSSGVGQVININAGSYTLPSEGTWFYFAFRWNTTSVQDSVGGIAAGGTLVCPSFVGQAWEGFAWRIT